MSGMTMEEFLGHSTRGGGGQFLKDWKDKGEILIWLHRRSGIHCLWRHGFKKIVEFKDKAPDIWGERFLCFETDEEVLRNQFRRDKETGVRLFPATCGQCRFLDDLYMAVKAKEISWTDEVFVFQAARKREVMHVGGLLGFFKSQKMTDDEKTELANHNIYPKEAWKEDGRPKAEYLFSVVDGRDPKSGVQVAITSSALGDKMRVEIAKQMKARKEKGDPSRNPYPFLWEYNADANFDDAYSITPMIEESPGPEILKLIDGPPPDVSGITRPHSPKMIRTLMEQYCVLDVGGWEKYFPDVAEESTPKSESVPEVRGPETAAAPEPVEELVACDKCEKPMKLTDTKCPHCGKTYEVESIKPAPALPPPPMKKRSEVKKDGTTAPVATLPKVPGPSNIDPAMFGGGGGDDDIPFIHCDVARMEGERWWRF